MAVAGQTCLAVLVATCVVACAARSVTPIAMTQSGDEQLTCLQIVGQIKTNRTAIADYLRKDKQVEQANTVFVLIGPTFLVDLSNEEQVKARSIADRNDRLVWLGRSKGCTEP